MWFVYHEDPLPLWNLAVVVSVVALLLVIAVQYRHGIRLAKGESWLRTCATYAAVPVGLLVMFPARAEYAAAAVCAMAFGDSAAALGGRRFGGRGLPWNPNKTWAGTFFFMAFAFPMVAAAYWGEARPQVTWVMAIYAGACATAVAAFAESLQSRLDDNLRIGVATALGLMLYEQWPPWLLGH